jgi:uncharacterized protein (DUF305 family)
MRDRPAGFFMAQGLELASMASFGIQAALCGLKLFKKILRTSKMNNANFFRTVAVCSAIALSAGVFSANAQPAAAMPADHSGMRHSADAEASASAEAFRQGGEKMMKDMDRPYTGDADKDFVAHMIPHHEGAVHMAQVQLKYGKDPELRKMARDIIQAQQKEIAFMKKWQARHGVK